jgi:hypothetical protein
MNFPLNPKASYTKCIYYFTMFIHVYVSMLLLYFTIFSYVYVSKLLALFHHVVCYVSMCSLYFTILTYVYVSKLLTLFHHTDMFMYPSYSHYFTIFSYVYVSMFLLYFTISFSMFMYPCFYSISPYILIIYVMYPSY